MNNYDVIKFDPLTYQLTAMKPFPMATVGSGAFVINSKAYRFMGASTTKQQAVYEYDPTKDNWTRKGDFPGEARGLMATFSLNGYGYLIGGYQAGNPYIYYKDCWQYDPGSDRWTQLDDYPGTGRNGLVSSVVGKTGIIGFGQDRADQFGNNDMWLFQPK